MSKISSLKCLKPFWGLHLITFGYIQCIVNIVDAILISEHTLNLQFCSKSET